jgi:hypothetical protein
MVASNLSDNSCHISLIWFVLNLNYKLTHQDVTRFKMEHTVWQLRCSQRYLSWSPKINTRSLYELDKNPLIKMMLQDSRCNALCNSSEAAREFCWSQKPDRRSLFELDKKPLIKMMLRDSKCDVLCDNSDAARDFCWSQKPNRRSFSTWQKPSHQDDAARFKMQQFRISVLWRQSCRSIWQMFSSICAAA